MVVCWMGRRQRNRERGETMETFREGKEEILGEGIEIPLEVFEDPPFVTLYEKV